ncbi:MAG TPA: cytochrome-c peroxidase, partial [Hyphomicrobiales bacterium]|nr:cytochrome-c peroxidase [Hyphomicrobiales bacterium]
MKRALAIACVGFWLPLAQGAEDLARQVQLEDLGRALFFDVNLSRDRTQSCATCHDPARAFTDWRDSGVNAAASLGDDQLSLGDRNAPTASYASLTPDFHRDAQGEYVGGQFWDGRAATLDAQAGGP